VHRIFLFFAKPALAKAFPYFLETFLRHFRSARRFARTSWFFLMNARDCPTTAKVSPTQWALASTLGRMSNANATIVVCMAR